MQRKKAVIYARVSTNPEKQEIQNQIRPLKDLAKALDFEIIEEYLDYCSGGDSNRPRFQKMLLDSRNRKFNTILIWSLDRFSREGILNTLSYLKQLRKNNVNLKSLQESWLDTSESGMGELLIAIFSWVAKQEREKLSERVKAGLKKAKNVGKRGKDIKPRKRLGYFRRYA